MRFASTLKRAGEVSFRQAVFTGLAPDGGLYHPVTQPDLRELIYSFKDELSFKQIAEALTHTLFPEEISRSGAKRIINRAFSFTPKLISLEDGMEMLELFHGPTCAFKDFGAAFLASTLEEFLTEENSRAVILVATSGDTGSAVARAFYRKKNIDVVILYPSGRVSPMQEKQLTTVGGNITALEIMGTFDDCQRMVKLAFMNKELNSSLNLTSANSINPGRLIPQAFYYIYAYVQLQKSPEDSVIFCVPSGNFGNLTAGVYAWQWGLPARGFIAATNINDVVPEYLQTGRFRPRPSIDTLSNAMDVGNPSNFERLIHGLGGDAAAMRRLIHGERVTDPETKEMIKKAHERYGRLIDPHTAVGIEAALRFKAKFPQKANHIIVLATAHPGKFCSIVEAETGVHPKIPESLEESLHRTKEATLMAGGLQELSSFLKDKFS